MKKFLGLFLLVFLTLNTCSILDYKTIAENINNISGAKWDLDITLPVISRTEDMNDYITISSIAPITVTDIVWPAAATYDLTGAPTNLSTTGSASVDFDGDGNDDFNLSSIESVSGDGYIELQITSDGDDIQTTDFSLTNFQLDAFAQNYTFGAAESVSSKVVRLRTTDFLSSVGATHSITGGTNADQIDIEALDWVVAQNRAGNLDFDFTIDFGTEYNVTGNLLTAKTVYSVTDQDVSFASTGMYEIKSFGLILEYNNQMPIVLTLNGTFKSDQTPAGSAITDANGNANIEISQGQTTTTLKTDNAGILKEDNVTVDIDVIIPAGALTITNNMIIEVKLIVTASGTLSTSI